MKIQTKFGFYFLLSMGLASAIAAWTPEARADHQSVTKDLICSNESEHPVVNQLIHGFQIKLTEYRQTENGKDQLSYSANEKEPTGLVQYWRNGAFFGGGGSVICQGLTVNAPSQLLCRGYWGDFYAAKNPVDLRINFSENEIISVTLLLEQAKIPLSCVLNNPTN